MVSIIALADLPAAVQSAELVETMVLAANAKASRVAPCLTWDGAPDSATPAPSEDVLAEARLILIGAVKRWCESGSGAFQQQAAGPFSVTTDTRQRTGYHLWPSEITGLQDICSTGSVGRQAFSIDTAPSRAGGSHLPWCSVFLNEPCSCGSSINGYEGPLWEFGYGPDHV